MWLTLAPVNAVPSAVKVTLWFPSTEFTSVVSVIVETDELPKSRATEGELNASLASNEDEAERFTLPLK